MRRNLDAVVLLVFLLAASEVAANGQTAHLRPHEAGEHVASTFANDLATTRKLKGVGKVPVYAPPSATLNAASAESNGNALLANEATAIMANAKGKRGSSSKGKRSSPSGPSGPSAPSSSDDISPTPFPTAAEPTPFPTSSLIPTGSAFPTITAFPTGTAFPTFSPTRSPEEASPSDPTDSSRGGKRGSSSSSGEGGSPSSGESGRGGGKRGGGSGSGKRGGGSGKRGSSSGERGEGSDTIEVPTAFALCYTAPELTSMPTEDELDDLLDVTNEFFEDYLEDFYDYTKFDFEGIDLWIGEKSFVAGEFCAEYIGTLDFHKDAPSANDVGTTLSNAPFEDYITDYLDELDSGFKSTEEVEHLDFFPLETDAPTPMPVPAPVSEFMIALELTNVPSQFQGAFSTSADRWEQVIIGDLPAVNITTDEITGSTCQALPAVVDDLHICASIVTIDGVDGVLGQAGPEFLRESDGSLIPFIGVMEFDVADVMALVANGEFDGVILHEMGHVVRTDNVFKCLAVSEQCELN